MPRLLDDHPLDLCCLGIGENGHLAFNDPPVADFDDPRDVKVVELDDACQRQQVGEGHFPRSTRCRPTRSPSRSPPCCAPATVLANVPEGRKAVPVRDALQGPVSTSYARHRRCAPASRARLYLDRDSASGLSFGRTTAPG